MCSSKKPNNTGHCIDHPRLLCRVKRWKFTVGTLVPNKRWFHRHSIGPLQCCVAPLSDAVVIARTGLTTYEPLYWATVDCGGTAVRSQGIKRPQCHFMLRYQCGKFPIARSAHSLVQRALHIHGFRSPMHGRNELVARVDVRSRRCGREAAPWGGNIVGRTTCATTPPGNNSVLLPSLNGNDIDWRISSDFFLSKGTTPLRVKTAIRMKYQQRIKKKNIVDGRVYVRVHTPLLQIFGQNRTTPMLCIKTPPLLQDGRLAPPCVETAGKTTLQSFVSFRVTGS